MGFESGAVSFRVFELVQGLPSDHLEKFASHAAPGVDLMGSNEISGWVSGRHMLDRNITDENAYYAGYLRLTLMQAKRKIPESYLRAECAVEEYAWLAATGADYVPRKEKMAIKKSVTERLLPTVPPTLKGIPFVYDENDGLIYAAAPSDKQHDAFFLSFKETTGIALKALDPQWTAFTRKTLDTEDLEAFSFSPECKENEVLNSVGQDFLTWLWFFSEARGGIRSFENIGRFGVIVEGPLTFMSDGDGAHEAVLRNGSPLQSAEAKTSLMCGKKLKRAKITLAREEEVWQCTVDADQFVFRGLKLPKVESLDAVSLFEQRMMSMNLFVKVFLYLYDDFLEERFDKERWSKTEKEIHAWVTDRNMRK